MGNKMESQIDMYSFLIIPLYLSYTIYFINRSMNNQLTLVF